MGMWGSANGGKWEWGKMGMGENGNMTNGNGGKWKWGKIEMGKNRTGANGN